MSISHVNLRDWYSLDGNMIVCGNCAQLMLDRTKRGEFTGDEAVTLSMLERITDSDVEAYQCDDCLTQNDAYEELGEDFD